MPPFTRTSNATRGNLLPPMYISSRRAHNHAHDPSCTPRSHGAASDSDDLEEPSVQNGEGEGGEDGEDEEESATDEINLELDVVDQAGIAEHVATRLEVDTEQDLDAASESASDVDSETADVFISCLEAAISDAVASASTDMLQSVQRRIHRARPSAVSRSRHGGVAPDSRPPTPDSGTDRCTDSSNTTLEDTAALSHASVVTSVQHHSRQTNSSSSSEELHATPNIEFPPHLRRPSTGYTEVEAKISGTHDDASLTQDPDSGKENKAPADEATPIARLYRSSGLQSGNTTNTSDRPYYHEQATTKPVIASPSRSAHGNKGKRAVAATGPSTAAPTTSLQSLEMPLSVPATREKVVESAIPAAAEKIPTFGAGHKRKGPRGGLEPRKLPKKAQSRTHKRARERAAAANSVE